MHHVLSLSETRTTATCYISLTLNDPSTNFKRVPVHDNHYKILVQVGCVQSILLGIKEHGPSVLSY